MHPQHVDTAALEIDMQLKPSAEIESYEFAMPKLTGPQVNPRGDRTLSSSLSSFCLTDTEDDGWY